MAPRADWDSVNNGTWVNTRGKGFWVKTRSTKVPIGKNFWRIPRVMRIPLLWSSRNHTRWSPKRKAKSNSQGWNKGETTPYWYLEREGKKKQHQEVFTPLVDFLGNHIKKVNCSIRENQTKQAKSRVKIQERGPAKEISKNLKT